MKIQDFKDQLRSQLQKICSDKKWDYANNKLRGMAFEDWCFELFHERYPAADMDIEQSVIRGDDMEIDIWFESKETEEIYLIQAKHPKPMASDPIDENEVKSFFSVYDLLKDKEYLKKRGSKNPKVKELENEFSYWIENNFTINLLFISTGENTDKITALVEQRNRSAGKANVKFLVWDVAELRNQFVEIKSVEEQYPDDIRFQLADGHYMELSSELENITFVIKGTVLQQIAHQYKDRLFNWNIRRFLGKKGEVNFNINETLEKEPQHFFYFNNGISALCSAFELDGKNELRIKKLQIVNGAQTIGALRYATPANAAKAQVLVKLTAIKHAERETGLAAAMIRTNNTQNALKIPDFRSNDRIQLWLEKEFKDLKPKGDLDKLVYGRKRPYPRNSANQTVLKLQDFGKIRFAWLHDPRTPIADPARLFALREDGGLYSDTFGNNGELANVWTEDQFEESLLAVHSYYKILDALADIQRESPELKQITRLKYYGLHLFKMYIDQTLPTSDGVTKNDLLLFGEKFNKYFATAMKVIRATLKQAYEEIVAREEGTAFSLPRDAKVWELVRKKFEANLSFALDLTRN